jgi:hypothetical protein
MIPQERITQQARYVSQFWPNPYTAGLAGNFISNPTRRRTAINSQDVTIAIFPRRTP